MEGGCCSAPLIQLPGRVEEHRGSSDLLARPGRWLGVVPDQRTADEGACARPQAAVPPVVRLSSRSCACGRRSRNGLTD
jgi:hypothetical protein